MSYDTFDADFAVMSRETEAQEARDELIASIKDEMVARRKAAKSDDDIRCAMEMCPPSMAKLIRDAIQREDGHLSLAVLKSMLNGWLEFDCEIEAIKSVEKTEKERD